VEDLCKFSDWFRGPANRLFCHSPYLQYSSSQSSSFSCFFFTLCGPGLVWRCIKGTMRLRGGLTYFFFFFFLRFFTICYFDSGVQPYVRWSQFPINTLYIFLAFSIRTRTLGISYCLLEITLASQFTQTLYNHCTW
jgi:hypothetical protein